MSDTRVVKKSRIRKLRSKGKFSFVEPLFQMSDDQVNEKVIAMIALDVAQRLFKFHKVKIIKRALGVVEYETSLEVIVPDTPKENQPRKTGRRGRKQP